MNEDIDMPTWKWDVINMDFIIGLLNTRRQHDSIQVLVDKMTMSSHFLAVQTIDFAEDYAKLYINEIVRLPGVPLCIISNRGPQVISYFWNSFKRSLGTQVNLNTIFHPQTDGQVEQTIQTLEDMLLACKIDFKGSWDDHLLSLSWPKIIATIPVFGQPLKRLYAGVDVDLLLVGLKQVKKL